MSTTKRRAVRLRFRKNDAEHNLLAAAQHYILAMGGPAPVIGGIQVQRSPGDRAYQYRLAVQITGRAPTAATEHTEEQ